MNEKVSVIDYEMSVQLVHKSTGERSAVMNGTARELARIFRDAFCNVEGQNPEDHIVLVLTEHVPQDDQVVIKVSQLPMVALPQFLEFVEGMNNV